jgi:predicted porin
MKHANTRYIHPLCVLASLLATTPAWSQTALGNVEFYGMIDAGVEAVNGTNNLSKQDETVYRVSNGMITPHFGFRGSEDLGSGMKAEFNLEGSFSPDVGVSGIGPRLFGRQSWVGLVSPLGTIRIGRQYTMVRYGYADANPYGTGNQGLRLLDERISNPRADNAVTYIVNAGGFSAGVNYSTGRDAVTATPATSAAATCPGEGTDSRQCREWSAGAKYNASTWGVATAYERMYGGTAATYGGLTSPDKTDSRFVVSGHVYLYGETKLTAGLIKRDNMGTPATPKSDMFWVQGLNLAHFGRLYFDAMAAELKYDNSPNKALLLNARARYRLSKRTTLYITAAHMDNSGTLAQSATASTPAIKPLPGGALTSVITGIKHTF